MQMDVIIWQMRTRQLCLVLLVLWMAAAPARAEGGLFSPLFNFFGRGPEIHLPHPEIHLPKLELPMFWTSDLKQGRDAFTRGDYAKARQAFLRASDEGNPVADWYLGHMYRMGRGVPMDAAIAYSYFSRVADAYDGDEDQSDPYRLRITVDAKIRVADYLRLGIPSAHLEANPQAAARTYLQMATNYAHPRALYELGEMSLNGEGMRKNPQQGLKWLYAATRKNSAEASALLGDLCADGTFVPQDDAKALSWYQIAAERTTSDENPQIFSRLNELKSAATEETRLEAEAKTGVWDEQNPVVAGH